MISNAPGYLSKIKLEIFEDGLSYKLHLARHKTMWNTNNACEAARIRINNASQWYQISQIKCGRWCHMSYWLELFWFPRWYGLGIWWMRMPGAQMMNDKREYQARPNIHVKRAIFHNQVLYVRNINRHRIHVKLVKRVWFVGDLTYL